MVKEGNSILVESSELFPAGLSLWSEPQGDWMNVKADPTTELMASRSKKEEWEEDPPWKAFPSDFDFHSFSRLYLFYMRLGHGGGGVLFTVHVLLTKAWFFRILQNGTSLLCGFTYLPSKVNMAPLWPACLAVISTLVLVLCMGSCPLQDCFFC